MNIKKGQRTHTETLRVTAKITNGWWMRKWGTEGLQYEPNLIAVTYRRTDGGEWKSERIRVYGRLVLKGGKLGADVEDAWAEAEWISDFVRDNKPSD